VLIGEVSVKSEEIEASCPTTATEWKDYLAGAPLDKWESIDTAAGSKWRRLKRCRDLPDQKKFFDDLRFQACIQPILFFGESRNFASQVPSKERLLNFKISDAEYFDPNRLDIPAVQEVPDFLKDQKLLRTLGDPKSEISDLEKASESIRKANPNAKIVLYKSQHLSSPDDAAVFGRVLIVLPGDRYDQWFQISRTLDSTEKREAPGNAFSLVSVQKRSSTGSALNEPVVRFNDYWRVHEGDKLRVSTRLKERSRLENCYQCHKTGVNSLNPDRAIAPYSLNPGTDGNALIKEINSMVGQYGNTRIDQVETRGFGPAMGAVGAKTRDDLFLGKCAKGVSPSSYPAIRKAMDCASCHDGRQLGVLNRPTGLRQDVNMFRSFIKHRMPPHSKLNEQERQALGDCLLTEYYGPEFATNQISSDSMYGKWLAPSDCPGDTGEVKCQPVKTSGEETAVNELRLDFATIEALVVEKATDRVTSPGTPCPPGRGTLANFKKDNPTDSGSAAENKTQSGSAQ
jgi:hypothetical protein